MVFFNCNACGQSVKKNQVEKHYLTKCRQCEVLSCLDCGKEFYGDEYKTHIKCISEDEKYGSVENREAAGKMSKGEVKQANWLQHVKLAAEAANLNPRMAGLVKQVTEYFNIPRKKAKFKNFLKNSLRITDEKTSEGLWQVFDSANKSESDSKAQAAKTSAAKETENKTDKTEETATKEKLPGKQDDSGEEKKSKTSKKDKKSKRKKADEDSQVDATDNSVDSDKSTKKKKKKKKQQECRDSAEGNPAENGQSQKESKRQKKKRKIEDTDTTEPDGKVDLSNSDKPKKKKKRKAEMANGEDQTEGSLKPGKRKRQENVGAESQQTNQIAEEEDDSQETNGPPGKKFRWESTIKSVLKTAAENEMSVKKLRKKVVGEYWAQGGDCRLKTEEEVLAAFNRKIHKCKKFKVHKEKVRLLNS